MEEKELLREEKPTAWQMRAAKREENLIRKSESNLKIVFKISKLEP